MKNVDIYSLHQKLKDRRISYVELLQESIKAAENSKSNCLISSTLESAQELAKNKDKQGRSPTNVLDGIPFTLKDLFITKDVRTTAGSLSLFNYIPPYDGYISAALKKAGAILVGKVSCDEFGMGSTNENTPFGVVNNPLNPSYVAGGSSGGSAAAVVEGIGLFSMGTDTGGSIRLPANFCGLTGLKPTYGRVSRYGQIAYASSLDQASPVAKTVLDVACVMEQITAKDPLDSTNAPLPPMQIVQELLSQGAEYLAGKTLGVERSFLDALSEDVKKELEDALKIFQKSGVKLVEIQLPHLKYCVSTYYLIATSEASTNLARYDGIHYGYRHNHKGDLEDTYIKSRTEGLGTEVKKRILLGTFALSAGYHDAYFKKACKMRRLIYQDYQQAFKQCEYIFAPVCASTAFPIGIGVKDSFQMYMNDLYTIPVNLAGLPGLALPHGQGSTGLPTGFQLVAPRFKDEDLLKFGHAFQKAQG